MCVCLFVSVFVYESDLPPEMLTCPRSARYWQPRSQPHTVRVGGRLRMHRDGSRWIGLRPTANTLLAYADTHNHHLPTFHFFLVFYGSLLKSRQISDTFLHYTCIYKTHTLSILRNKFQQIGVILFFSNIRFLIQGSIFLNQKLSIKKHIKN